MNADGLLELYEQISEAPDAVARLRRFVLDLAVRGKLVEQDAGDEPARLLMQAIEAEKVRLAKSGEIRKRDTKTFPMLPSSHELPASWCWTAVGNCFVYDAGSKTNPEALDQNQWLLELEDVEKSTGRILRKLRVADREAKSTKSQFRKGDVLYGKLRPYLNKVVVADEAGYSTTEIVAIRPHLSLCSEYVALAFRRSDFVDYVERTGQGTKMPRLRTEDAVVAPFPLPPLAEQHRIVAKVDELMGLCDRLEAARVAREEVRDKLTAASLARLTAPDAGSTNTPDQTTEASGATDNTPAAPAFNTHARFALETLPALTSRPDQIKTLRQTILNLALRGKLVEQDPADEPGQTLFDKIRDAKATDVSPQELKRSAKFACEASSLPFDVPPNWCVAALRELSYNLGDGLHGTPTYVSAGDIYFVNGTNLRGGKVTIFENTKRVSHEEWVKYAKPLSERTLLVSINGTLTNYAFYRGERILLGKSACYFELSPLIDMQFIRVLIQSPYYLEFASSMATGTTIKNLSLKAVNSFPVPLPPLGEQHRIVAKVDALMALCDRLEAALTTADTTRTQLLNALLHEALTPATPIPEAAE